MTHSQFLLVSAHLKYPDQNSDDELTVTPSERSPPTVVSPDATDSTTIILQNNLDESNGSGLSPFFGEEEQTQMTPVRDLEPTTRNDPQSGTPPSKGSNVTPESSKKNTSRGFCSLYNKIISGL